MLAEPESKGYGLGPGDIITLNERGITAMKAIFRVGGLSENTLQSQVRILSRGGEIRKPFLLDVGKTRLDEAGDSNPVLNPGDLMVVMGPSPENIISVLGKVRRPGIIQYADGLTALQAILQSGGFDRGAARSKVKIIRGQGQEQQELRANLEELMEKGDRAADVGLLPPTPPVGSSTTKTLAALVSCFFFFTSLTMVPKPAMLLGNLPRKIDLLCG